MVDSFGNAHLCLQFAHCYSYRELIHFHAAVVFVSLSEAQPCIL